jgi:hypothetical protein
MAWCLEKLAEVSNLQGLGERAVVLYGAASALRASIGSVIDPVNQPAYERRLEGLRAQLGESVFEKALEFSVGLDQGGRMAFSLGE